MHNFIRLFKLIDKNHKGFIKKSIIFSLLTGLLPLFNVIAPKLIIDEYQNLRRLNIMFMIALIALVLAFLNKIINLYSNNYYERTMQVFNDELSYKVNEKVLSLPIEMTDSKSIQDKTQQALYAVGSTYSLLEFMSFASGAVITGIFSIVILIKLNFIIPLILIILVILNKPLSKIIKDNEKDYQKRSAGDIRIYNYYFKFAKDYKYSKDIKIFNAEKMILEKAAYHMNELRIPTKKEI